MFLDLLPRDLVRRAREAAGLSQRVMAERAGTAQSVVARVEAGITDPSSETLNRLLSAAGYAIRCELVPRPICHSHMMDDVERILSLTPEERLDEVRNVSRFEAAVRRV